MQVSERQKKQPGRSNIGAVLAPAVVTNLAFIRVNQNTISLSCKSHKGCEGCQSPGKNRSKKCTITSSHCTNIKLVAATTSDFSERTEVA